MPLPMPSLPPVTSAVLPVKLKVHVDLPMVRVLDVCAQAALWASQRPASAAENSSAKAAFTAAGSSLLMV